jgi:hypothetical protein
MVRKHDRILSRTKDYELSPGPRPGQNPGTVRAANGRPARYRGQKDLLAHCPKSTSSDGQRHSHQMLPVRVSVSHPPGLYPRPTGVPPSPVFRVFLENKRVNTLRPKGGPWATQLANAIFVRNPPKPKASFVLSKTVRCLLLFGRLAHDSAKQEKINRQKMKMPMCLAEWKLETYNLGSKVIVLFSRKRASKE